MNTKLDSTASNALILASRVAKYNERPNACVGDYLKLWTKSEPCPAWLFEYTRFTHDWGDRIQTGGSAGGRYYLGDGFLSYSGSLDSGVDHADLVATAETKPGNVWFFHEDISGAGRGVDFQIPQRVFTLRPGADTKGIEFEREYFHLTVCTEEYHKQTCNYWYIVTCGAMSHTAFTTEQQLQAWMDKKGLVLAQPLTPPGVFSSQRLLRAAITKAA
jgi:hypothetical protein